MSHLNASRQLREELHLLEAMVRALKEEVLVTDGDGRIVCTNPMAERGLGYSKAELLGRSFHQLCSPANPPGLLADIISSCRNGGWEGECIMLRKDGSGFSAHITATPIRDAGGELMGLVWVLHRLTREGALEQKLMESERLSVMGRLTQGVAHNFNNILHIILGHTEVARERMSLLPQSELTAELDNRLDTIALAAVNAAEMVKLVRAFTPLQREERQNVGIDINQVVRDAIHITGPFWRDEPQKKGFTIQMEVKKGDVKSISGSVAELMIAFANIIINAVEAMPSGGKISIATWCQQNFVYVKISDTGHGVCSEIANRMFEPFFTTKGEEHSGLGLSSALAAVNNQGGDILCHSEEGHGAAFIIKLPLGKDRAEERKRVAPSPLRRSTKRSILVIDDDASVCEPLLSLLQMRGYRVQSETDPQKALDIIARRPFDMVITDLGMPRVSGWQMARAIKDIKPETRVVVLTGWQIAPHDPVLKEGLVDFIATKPLRREELLGILDGAFAGDA